MSSAGSALSTIMGTPGNSGPSGMALAHLVAEFARIRANRNSCEFRYTLGYRIERVMARCEEGYLCDVCGAEVAEITDSDLYLRYILGEVSLASLHVSRERHIR